MNSSRLRWICVGVTCTLLLAGCFGGKAPLLRAESQQRADTALVRGVRAEQKGNYQEAEKLLSEALTTSSSIEDYVGRTTALINLARLHRLQHDLLKSESFIDQALALPTTDPRQTAEAAQEKALLELAKGNPAQALEWAQQALATEPGNLRGSRRNLTARIQLLLGNRSAADTLARAALPENRSSGQAEEEANSLRIMGIIARHETKYSESVLYLQEALVIDKRIGKSAKIALDLEELAAVAQQAGNLQTAADYLARAYDVNNAADRLQQALHNQVALAKIYEVLGNPLKAAMARDLVQKLAARSGVQQPPTSPETIKPSSKP